ncbi:MAG: hypothetical protein V2B20_01265, partial [Pseudomonadota bacterium]
QGAQLICRSPQIAENAASLSYATKSANVRPSATTSGNNPILQQLFSTGIPCERLLFCRSYRIIGYSSNLQLSAQRPPQLSGDDSPISIEAKVRVGFAPSNALASLKLHINLLR